MANVFETYTSRAVGNSLTAVGSHTTGSGHTETVIGLTVSNVTASAVSVNVTYNDGTNDTYIVKNAPLPSGAAIVPIGGDQKICLTFQDSIKVSANTASSIDAVMSVLDQS
jgi:hypothetical protein